ncbi:MAG: S-layer homology domain-containing protein, partial [Bacteroidales bacterium]|nr:S-layer homology domain-containing protein [Bacteroidales bacterium]
SDSATVTVTVTEIPITKYEVEVNNGTGGGSYEVGATVTITADTAPSGQVFAKWTTADGVAFTNANASTTTFTMPAKAVTVTATYKDKQTSNEDDDTPGGSGSSSSGSSSDIGKDQATVSAANGQVPINYTVSKGIATLSLTTSKINKIIEESKGNEVVIDLSKVKDISAVSLPKKALETFKDAGFDVTLKLPTGTITMDKDAAASIADQSGENLTIELKQVASSTLTDEQKEAIKKDDIVFEINIISGTKKITNFDGSLTFQIPYDGPQPVAVWYLNEKGDLEKLNSIFENGMVTFSTNHLSYYVVGVDETKTEVKWVNPFADVKEDNWFYEAVKYVYENDLMKGTGDNTFSPNEMTTRGMIVTILHRLEDSPSAGANSFSDVEGNKYYANAVAWASENNIVSGYGNGKFGPEDAITREQLATILMNYANYKGYDVSAKADLSKYEDSKEISNWALDAISWANAEGLIQGDGNNLTPTANATRAQVATILNRFIEKNVK